MTAGVILAAGRSARMGRPKGLLRHVPTGDTFVSYLVGTARTVNLDPVFVVGRAADDALAAEVRRSGASLLVNGDPDRGQLSSILVGLDAAQRAGADALVVMPVDVPLLTSAVLHAVIAAAATTDAAIVRACHRGRHGHPVLFKREVFDELRSADLSIGARAVVRADPRRVKDVEVDDPGVTFDIDTPDDYRRAFGVELRVET